MMPERPVGRQPAREDRSLGELFAELMGEVTESELCRVASRLPLIPIAEVLTAKAGGGEEGMTGGPEQLVPGRTAAEGWSGWLH